MSAPKGIVVMGASAGGRVVAQNESTAQHFGMPGAAILAGGVDEVLALDEIGRADIDFAAVGA